MEVGRVEWEEAGVEDAEKKSADLMERWLPGCLVEVEVASETLTPLVP